MNLRLGIVMVMMLLFAFACKKQSDPAIPPPFYPPNDTTAHTATPLPIVLDVTNGTSLYNTWGRLIALMSDSTTVLSPGDTVYSSGQYGIALFVDSSVTTYLDAGIISLNNDTVPHPPQYPFYKGNAIALQYGANWAIQGSADVPSFNFNYSGGFPSYSGPIPYQVSKDSGLHFTFNGTTVANADSVYVVITTVDSNNTVSYRQCFGANQGNVFITGSLYNFLPVSSISQGHLTIIPFKYTAQAFGHKKFVFVKQSEISHSVSIQ